MSTDGEGRERADDEVDAAWADIIARLGPLDAPAPESPREVPGRRDGEVDGRRRAGDGRDAADAGPADHRDADAPPPRVLPRAVGPRDHAPPSGADGTDGADDDDHFVPEDPAPLRGVGLAWWAPWLALVGAPVLLGVVALARGSVPTWLLLAAVAVFAGGAVAAVLRLPSRTDERGDGAVL